MGAKKNKQNPGRVGAQQAMKRKDMPLKMLSDT
jgi:hypothetical protein